MLAIHGGVLLHAAATVVIDGVLHELIVEPDHKL